MTRSDPHTAVPPPGPFALVGALRLGAASAVAVALTLAGCRSGSRAPASGSAVSGGTAPATRAPGPSGTVADGAIAAAPTGANWPMPNPPSSGLPNPEQYDTATPGVVLDTVTGLMWQATANTTGMYWPAARTSCQALSLAGHDDWRLPSHIELVSLVDFSRTNPAVDGSAFPTGVGGTVWTSTQMVGSPGEAWYVSFNTGFTYHGHEDLLPIDVRCVRAGRPDPPGGRYSFPTADTVSDGQTGLVWQRNADAIRRSWEDAGRACASLALPGAGWRLPSMKELQTILDLTRDIPALDPTVFPGAPIDQYWTSSPLAGSNTDAWAISFRLGIANPDARGNLGYVRCVR